MKKSQSTRLILCTACLLLHSVHATRMTKERIECMGTNAEMSYPMDFMQHYRGLVKRYTNCTYVNGNLEITGIPENMDMSFVKDIEIVTGYVIIAMNKVDYVPLENLMVIRGQELYHDKDALYVSVNINRALPFVGLKAVGLKSLTEIQRGNIHFTENHLLCYVDTINWLDIINPTAREKNGWSVYINNTRDPAITCESCHKSCNGSCWGPGEDDCQKLTSTICHQRCGNSRCRGPGPDECCHRECAVGCTGPTDADCIVCQHINNSGICQLTCPQKHIFDPQTQRFVENPDVKYHLNGDCVDHCPEHMLVEDNGCVKHCRKGNHNNGEGECVPCAEDACNKECYGIGNPDAPGALADTVDANNTKYFEGCNIVRGNIIIQAYVFEGDEQNYIPAMTAEQVMKSFSSIKVINGYLNILGWHKNLSDFSAFGNLTTIRGNQLFRGVAAIVIQDTTAGSPYHLDSITSLGFRSLKRVEHGNVYIGYMRNLCYVDSVNWTQVLKNPRMSSPNRFRNGVMLRNNKRCYDEHPCHPACDDNGCWGPKDNECVTCSNIVFGDRCVLDCDKELGVYNSGKECVPCDSECEYTCDGAGPMNCTRCKNFNNVGVCVPDCPNDMYGDEDTRTCLPCNETCLHQRNNSNSPMCSGPASKLGSGGCTFCHTVMADRHLRRQQCLPITSRNCPPAHYGYDNAGMSDTKLICVPCIQGCRNCTGSTEKDCVHSLPQGESAIVMSIVILVVFIVLVAVVMLLIRHRRKKSEKERQKSLRALGLAEGVRPVIETVSKKEFRNDFSDSTPLVPLS